MAAPTKTESSYLPVARTQFYEWMAETSSREASPEEAYGQHHRKVRIACNSSQAIPETDQDALRWLRG